MAKKTRIRILVGIGVALLAVANWPVLILVNRVRPFIMGLPPFIFTMLVLNLLVALLLFIAYRVID